MVNERYRLMQIGEINDVLLIQTSNERNIFDCFVRAIREDTDTDQFLKQKHWRAAFTDVMGFDEIRNYVAQDTSLLGRVNDCLGIVLEDDRDTRIYFNDPIRVRTYRRE
jgi:hypothetical protein